MEDFRTATASGQYGPLQPNFTYTLRLGYTALVGPNNAGKSALLQLIFRTLMDDNEIGPARVALVLPDRQNVSDTTQTSGRTLEAWNTELVNNLRNQPLAYATNTPGPNRAEFTRVLMHGSLISQVHAMNELLVRLGLKPFDLKADQRVEFEDVYVTFQGTGLRGVLPIVAALSNPDLRVLLIDEPELSLEPRLQKVLREVLIAASETRIVVVATHSHLFVGRDVVEANQIVGRGAPNETTIHTLASRSELYDVVFDLLGSSTEDLFFPGNYVIVEGASDQVIVAKVLELLGSPPPTIKVLAARGIDAVRDAVESVYRASVPLVVNDSPYAGRVVALVDKPNDPEAPNFKKLTAALPGRLFVLDATSMEEYLPDGIYAEAGREKEADLNALAVGNRSAREVLKREISNDLAASLNSDDLDSIRIIVDAARSAIDAAT